MTAVSLMGNKKKLFNDENCYFCPNLFVSILSLNDKNIWQIEMTTRRGHKVSRKLY